MPESLSEDLWASGTICLLESPSPSVGLGMAELQFLPQKGRDERGEKVAKTQQLAERCM